MAETNHKHTKPLFSADNKIVCDECHKEHGGNECFCKCHESANFSCMKCAIFHKV